MHIDLMSIIMYLSVCSVRVTWFLATVMILVTIVVIVVVGPSGVISVIAVSSVIISGIIAIVPELSAT